MEGEKRDKGTGEEGHKLMRGEGGKFDAEEVNKYVGKVMFTGVRDEEFVGARELLQHHQAGILC